ncbi:LytR/AlgR family response regulator transcription factor [Pleionea litopenaei]|uniref:LytTR family DNA-binding domain-containing protein n=1 Tax=Pleionea litopenaei TaxID=3070815 RepID=A0AA51X679_9GAMM|nr:LytTR family DNA-binding domain-containing protein [Pleionea sp. HL-JVS1]WMS85810.1 LytTR family DNA-binding domain-containing protein [Pleionea sp. HL-JVS1]
MTRLEHFQKHQTYYVIGLVSAFFIINAIILATSIVMEALRGESPPNFALWEPFLWEFTSAIATALLLPLLLRFIDRYPFNWQAIRVTALRYLAASVVYSAAHVLMMVGLRKATYWLVDERYQFGHWGYEFLYEYRKDLWSFIFLLAVIHSYRFIVSRLQGEANIVVNDEEPNNEGQFDRLLVKKLGKEFIIKVDDVEWLESSGNYVNLHSKGRIYPMRTTLKSLIDKISDKGFARIHRSHAVNLDCVSEITPLPSGDSVVQLSSGKELLLSRRYKEQFRSLMSS